MESQRHRWQHLPVISPHDMKNPLFGNPFSILSNWPLDAINPNKTFDYVKPPQPKRFVPCCLSVNILSKSLSAVEKEQSKPNEIEENLNEMTPKNKQKHPKKKRRERRRKKKKKKNLHEAPIAAETNDIVKRRDMIPRVQCESDDSFIIFEDDPSGNSFDYSLKRNSHVSPTYIYFPFQLRNHFPSEKSTETNEFVEAQAMLPMDVRSLKPIGSTENSDVPQGDFEPIILRTRYPSECESDDSFIIFDDDPCGKSFDTSLKPNSCVSSTYSCYPYDATEVFSNKKVRFAEPEQLCKVHHMVQWSYAYKKARKGPWEQYALDRMRFRHRINELKPILDYVLQPSHRSQIYKDRFQK